MRYRRERRAYGGSGKDLRVKRRWSGNRSTQSSCSGRIEARVSGGLARPRLGGGEDYELIVTAPAEAFQRLDKVLAGNLQVIGKISERPSATQHPISAIGVDGSTIAVAHYGWDHFGD